MTTSAVPLPVARHESMATSLVMAALPLQVSRHRHCLGGEAADSAAAAAACDPTLLSHLDGASHKGQEPRLPALPQGY